MPDELTFTREDFISGSAPYEMLYRVKDDRFQHGQLMDRISDYAKKIGYIGFKARYKDYCESIKSLTPKPVGNVTDFEQAKLELDTGKWIAGEYGIYTLTNSGEQVACPHPIMPIERLVNIDTGTEKLRLAFRKAKKWREVIVEKSVIASPNSIIKLADSGVSVTSETAKALISYLQDVENLNYSAIPERYSVGRLGWIDGHGFSPYVEKLMFDGDANFRTFFESVKTVGKRDESMNIMSEVRHGSLTARIVLAASFASVLVGPCGCLPFFVHLWGSESGTGKTVILMVAASVWAYPVIGHYIQTFNSTVVGRERIASFFNSMPMLIDELQLSKDNKGKQQFDVYALAEGVGRTRGTKTGGLDKTPTWSNCIITTGESPITSAGAGAGAMNRVIDIECRPDEPVIEDGHRLSNAVKRSYGHLGKEFIAKLDEAGIAEAQRIYQDYFKELSASDTTEKQAMAAALILTADQLATEWIFSDDQQLTVSEIQRFLLTKAQVSANLRAYEFLCDWIALNQSKFEEKAQGDVYGVIDMDVAYIIPTVLFRALDDEGYSSKAFVSWLKKTELLDCDGRHMTVKHTISNRRTRCYAIHLPDSGATLFD